MRFQDAARTVTPRLKPPHPAFLAALALLSVVGASRTALADPQLSSWFTADSGQYARLYESTAAETAGTVSKTWSRGQGVQSSPTYSGVHQIDSSTNWVYIRTTGLASHIMGPWYLDAAKSQNFPNFPSNTATIYRIPRVPVIPVTKTSTGLGTTGRMVNGVSIFDSRDAFSYSNSNATDATPVNGITGDGIWNRDGYHNEGVTFDPALAHQAGNNYHYHAHPIGLRFQLGDHVDYNPVTNRYAESTGPPARHSPILGWAADGLPVYGPYGYGSPTDPSSGVRRMVSSFILRTGSQGTTNLAAVGRTTLPAWAARIQGRSAALAASQYGPAVSSSYLLGHYIEDFDYLGDLGYTQGVDFDLNEQNVRFCVTPEFPSGTWAYFTPINADGTPAFPYTTGRQYFGTPSGGNVTSITESVTNIFKGGPNKPDTPDTPGISGTDTTLTWSAVEGGTYQVEGTEDFLSWTSVGGAITASDDQAAVVDAGAVASHPRRFYKITRTALAGFDSNGFTSTGGGGGGTTTASIAPGGNASPGDIVTITITLPTSPPRPPADRVPASVTLAGSIAGSSISRPDAATVLATFVIPSGASAGAQNIVVTFNPAPTYTMSGAFTIN